MEWYEIVFKILEILKWPFALVIIVALFRKQIINLIGGIKKVGYKNFEFQSENMQKTIAGNGKLETELSGVESPDPLKKLQKATNFFDESTIDYAKANVAKLIELNNITDPEKKVALLYEYSAFLLISNQFAAIDYAIYGSQIKLLQLVNTLQKYTLIDLQYLYNKAKEQYSPSLDNYSYEDYINWMKSVGLIEVDEGQSVTITIKGRDFLNFLVKTGRSFDRSF